MLRKRFLAISILCFFIVSMGSCGGGGGGSTGGNEHPTPSEPTSPVSNVVFAQIQGTETPFIAIASTNDAKEAIGVLVERDSIGKPIRVSGAIYFSPQGYIGKIEFGVDGLPTSFSDSTGNKFVYTNYTSDTVQMSLYDFTGKPLSMVPITLRVDPNGLSQIKSFYNSITFVTVSIINGQKGVAAFSRSGLATALKYVSLASSWIGCATSAYAAVGTIGVLTPLVVSSCGSALLSSVIAVTGDPGAGVAMGILSASACSTGSVFSCISSFASAAAGLIAPPSPTPNPAPTPTQPPTPTPPPTISNISPNPVTASNSQQTITLTGSNFQSGLTVTVGWTGSSKALDSSQVAVDSSSQIRIFITTTTTPDNWWVKIANPDGQISNTANFSVIAAAPSSYSISGRVTSNGVGLSGVTITLSGIDSSTTTDSNGNYVFTGQQNGAYTITPSFAGYTFNPSNRSVAVSSANVTGQDFVATASGRSGGAEGTLKWKAPYAGALAMGIDGTIYSNTREYIYAVNLDGSLKWKYYLGGISNVLSNPPTIGKDGTIYTGIDSFLFALRQDGTLKWKYYIIGAIDNSTPSLGADGTIYLASYGYVHAINPDGTKKWIFGTPDLDFRYSSPAIASDGTIYIGDKGNSFTYGLYAINPDGTLKWRFKTDEPITSSPAIGSDGTIYFGRSYLYAVRPDGKLKWSLSIGSIAGGGWSSSPTMGIDGTIYVGSNYAFNAVNPDGTLKWRFSDNSISPPKAAAIGSDGTVYVGTSYNGVYAFNPSGTIKWNYSYGGDSEPLIGPDGTLYISQSSLYAINTSSTGLANSPWPRFKHDNQNTGRK